MFKHSMRLRASVDPSPFSGPRAREANAIRQEAIARRAYELAQQRSFEPGHELEDWVTAEREYDEALYR